MWGEEEGWKGPARQLDGRIGSRERESLVYRLILHYLPFTLLVGPSYKKLFAIYFVNA